MHLLERGGLRCQAREVLCWQPGSEQGQSGQGSYSASHKRLSVQILVKLEHYATKGLCVREGGLLLGASSDADPGHSSGRHRSVCSQIL
mmetsp:Transcript_24580/g.38678  ORF Transcript_24580/g.38678 Transcript_24580/m.38678 type:complete len:89 (-) Transcript_24580:36-302(-)